MAKLETIEGIGPVYAEQLRRHGIGSVQALLEAGATPHGRADLEDRTGIGHKLILEWVNLADLMRIKGVGEEYSDLLEEAGVDTVKELRHRVPANLHRKMLAVNEAKRLVRRPPALSQVEDWVEQAKSLPTKVGNGPELGRLLRRLPEGWEPLGPGEPVRRPVRRPPLPPEEPGPRYANVGLVDPTTSEIYPDEKPLYSETEYDLRIKVGRLEDWDSDENPPPFEVPYESERSDKGYWLDVIVTSEDFNIEKEQYALFLPDEGESWVCKCERDVEHHCRSNEREDSLYVRVTTPVGSGEATLRVGFYFKNNLLQSRLFTAWVVTEVPEGEEKGYKSVTDYILTRSLTNVERFPARTLNIFTNENPDGSHRLIAVSGEYVRHSSLSEIKTRRLLRKAREKLHDTHLELTVKPKYHPTTKETLVTAEYKPRTKTIDGVTNAKEPRQFKNDLKTLAMLGSDLWVTLFSGHKDSRRELRRLLKAQATIQFGRARKNKRKRNGPPPIFPWALVYDIYLLGDDQSKWHFCKLLDDWKPGKPLIDPKVTKCPHDNGHNHHENIICPFGFWGFKHVLEHQPSWPDEQVDTIKLSGEKPDVAVGLSLQLHKPRDHVKELKGRLSDRALIMAEDSKEDILKMLSKSDLEFVYLFCHGMRNKKPGEDVWLPCLTVGKGEPLTVADLMNWSDNLPDDHWMTSPLVFINGCHTAELSPETLADFVHEFIDANAGGVIGTEVSVAQDLASEAALLFFSHMLDNGGNVGVAMRRMRWDFLSKGNLMGVAYTPYCSADLHLEK